MGDNIKIAKDKRHRSSSNLVGNSLEGTFSERKLNIRGSGSVIASIPEIEDKFLAAENRCDELREKLEYVKQLKKQRRKLKKRSTTKINSGDEVRGGFPVQQEARHMREPNQFITVHAQPKRKALPVNRSRRPPESFRNLRSYVDPDTTEQQLMLGQIRHHDENYTRQYLDMLQSLPKDANLQNLDRETLDRLRRKKRLAKAEGDMIQRSRLAGDAGERHSGEPVDQSRVINKRHGATPPMMRNHQQGRHREEEGGDEGTINIDMRSPRFGASGPVSNNRGGRQLNSFAAQPPKVKEERQVVELFNKNNVKPDRNRQNPGFRAVKAHPAPVDHERENNADAAEAKTLRNMKKLLLERSSTNTFNEDEASHKAPTKVVSRIRNRGRHRSRGYELPTVASQMKQKGLPCNYGVSHFTNIPFVASKSTAPSHNIGINIQQVLNGMKMQQPITGIPLTIAHHMGLRHSPTWGVTQSAKSAPETSSLEMREINVIKLGRRLVRLPSYKYISYNKFLNLYREGEGMVPRFLRAMTRPDYFYNSMFNLSARGDSGPPSCKRRTSGQEVKQTLAEYGNLYREYESLNKELKNGKDDAEMARRVEELSRELAAREDHIRRVLTTYKTSMPTMANLHASASTTDGLDRIGSAFKLNTASEI